MRKGVASRSRTDGLSWRRSLVHLLMLIKSKRVFMTRRGRPSFTEETLFMLLPQLLLLLLVLLLQLMQLVRCQNLDLTRRCSNGDAVQHWHVHDCVRVLKTFKSSRSSRSMYEYFELIPNDEIHARRCALSRRVT